LNILNTKFNRTQFKSFGEETLENKHPPITRSFYSSWYRPHDHSFTTLYATSAKSLKQLLNSTAD